MIYPEYDSPLIVNTINDVAENIGKQIDEMCVRALHKIAIDVDEKTLIEALKQDSSRYREAYNKGYETRDTEIVRCKDCWKKGNPYLCRFDSDLEEHGGHRTEANDDWFCADGEREEGR